MKKLDSIKNYSPCSEQGGGYGGGGGTKRKITTAGGSNHNGQPYSSDLKKERNGETIWIEFYLLP